MMTMTAVQQEEEEEEKREQPKSPPRSDLHWQFVNIGTVLYCTVLY